MGVSPERDLTDLRGHRSIGWTQRSLYLILELYSEQRMKYWNIVSISGFHHPLRVFVLVSARTEFIFFLVAGIVQCFGFSRKIMLITH